MNSPLFRLENVTFTYLPEKQNKPLYKKFNLDLQTGGVTCLMGPNGSGKTTLLSLLLGYNKPQWGMIFFEGRELTQYNRRDLGQKIGFVSQASAQPFNFSVEDYVLLGRAACKNGWELPNRQDRAAAAAAIELAGIQGLRGKHIQQISAGELQLVSIARSLCQNPKVLLLDEPVSHLDPANAMGIYSLLKKLADQGISVILTLHDPAAACRLGTNAVLLKEGRIHAAGPVEQVLTRNNLEQLYNTPFDLIPYKFGEIPVPRFPD